MSDSLGFRGIVPVVALDIDPVVTIVGVGGAPEGVFETEAVTGRGTLPYEGQKKILGRQKPDSQCLRSYSFLDLAAISP